MLLRFRKVVAATIVQDQLHHSPSCEAQPACRAENGTREHPWLDYKRSRESRRNSRGPAQTAFAKALEASGSKPPVVRTVSLSCLGHEISQAQDSSPPLGEVPLRWTARHAGGCAERSPSQDPLPTSHRRGAAKGRLECPSPRAWRGTLQCVIPPRPRALAATTSRSIQREVRHLLGRRPVQEVRRAARPGPKTVKRPPHPQDSASNAK